MIEISNKICYNYINIDKLSKGGVLLFWIFVFLFVAICAVAGLLYLLARFRKFSFVKKLSKDKIALEIAIPLIMLIAIVLITGVALNAFSSLIVIVHVGIFFVLVDIITFIAKKAFKKELNLDVMGIVATLCTIVYLSFGWYFAHHVYQTDYSIDTDKDIGSLKVAFLADSHLGITLDGEEFTAEIKEINEQSPDIVFVVGDFVDDDSTFADLKKSCEALGSIEAKYGVYFVFGNHDKGFSTEKDYTVTQLRDEMAANGVKILEDEAVLIDDRFYVIGRQDASENTRLPMSELTEGLDASKYMIVLDHQPNDYDAQQEANVDLVLSGHTHAGHIFPAGIIGIVTGMNDKLYGYENIGGTDFIVTSGISGWAIPFKTFATCEYVIIDIE